MILGIVNICNSFIFDDGFNFDMILGKLDYKF